MLLHYWELTHGRLSKARRARFKQKAWGCKNLLEARNELAWTAIQREPKLERANDLVVSLTLRDVDPNWGQRKTKARRPNKRTGKKRPGSVPAQPTFVTGFTGESRRSDASQTRMTRHVGAQRYCPSCGALEEACRC